MALSSETKDLALAEITRTLAERGVNDAKKQACTDFADRLRRARKAMDRWQETLQSVQVETYVELLQENHIRSLRTIFRAKPGVSKEIARQIVEELMAST